MGGIQLINGLLLRIQDTHIDGAWTEMEDWIHVAFAVQLFQGSQTFDV
jgi:hypothetical protein